MPCAQPALHESGGNEVIAHLSGVGRRAGTDFVVVDVGGVGYMVSVSTSTRQLLPPPGGDIELDIHTHVREDQLALYGFASAAELDMFEMLIQVDGVGPKVGLNILGAASLEVLKRAIVSEDAAPIRRASGVALRTCGFSSQEARVGIESVDWKSTPNAQEALAVALKALGRK